MDLSTMSYVVPTAISYAGVGRCRGGKQGGEASEEELGEGAGRERRRAGRGLGGTR